VNGEGDFVNHGQKNAATPTVSNTSQKPETVPNPPSQAAQVQDTFQQHHVPTNTQSSLEKLQPNMTQSQELPPVGLQQPLQPQPTQTTVPLNGVQAQPAPEAKTIQTATAPHAIPVEEFLAQPVPAPSAQTTQVPNSTLSQTQQSKSPHEQDTRPPSLNTVSTRDSEADVFVDASEGGKTS
jgi:hypothetical protein